MSDTERASAATREAVQAGGCSAARLKEASRTSGGACHRAALSPHALGAVHFAVAVPPSSCFILCPAEATESVTCSGTESALMAGSHDGHTTGLQLAAHMCSPSQQRYPRAPCPAPGAAWTDPAARPDAARAPRREMRTSWMASLRGLGVWAGGRVVRERSKSFVTPKKRAHTMARNRKTCALPEGVTLTLYATLLSMFAHENADLLTRVNVQGYLRRTPRC